MICKRKEVMFNYTYFHVVSYFVYLETFVYQYYNTSSLIIVNYVHKSECFNKIIKTEPPTKLNFERHYCYYVEMVFGYFILNYEKVNSLGEETYISTMKMKMRSENWYLTSSVQINKHINQYF